MGIYNPRQVILVSSRADMTILGRELIKDNIITVAWHMPISFKPFLYAISIGKTRFSCKMIQKSKVFVVNFISAELEKKALFCGMHTGEHIDKFDEAPFSKEESQSVDCPRINEGIGHLECEVINEIDAGDHIIFIGKVIREELKKEGKRLFQDEGGAFTTTK